MQVKSMISTLLFTAPVLVMAVFWAVNNAAAENGAAITDAAICKLPAQIYVAEYRVLRDGAEIATLKIVRGDNRVMHIRSNSTGAEMWERNANGSVHFTRFYDQARRGLEHYEANPLDPSSQLDWDLAWQLVPEAVLSGHQAEAETSDGECAEQLHYAYEENGTEHRIDWLPQQQLVRRLQEQGSGKTMVWELSSVSTDPQSMTRELDAREDYRVIDFADLGDQESDPFFQTLKADHGH